MKYYLQRQRIVYNLSLRMQISILNSLGKLNKSALPEGQMSVQWTDTYLIPTIAHNPPQ